MVFEFTLNRGREDANMEAGELTVVANYAAHGRK